MEWKFEFILNKLKLPLHLGNNLADSLASAKGQHESPLKGGDKMDAESAQKLPGHLLRSVFLDQDAFAGWADVMMTHFSNGNTQAALVIARELRQRLEDMPPAVAAKDYFLRAVGQVEAILLYAQS